MVVAGFQVPNHISVYILDTNFQFIFTARRLFVGLGLSDAILN